MPITIAAAAVAALAWGPPAAAGTGPRGDHAKAEATPPDIGVVVSDGNIVGSTDLFGPKDIFVYRDGTLTRLTHNAYDPETDYTPSSMAPSLSPDGSKIVYLHCDLEEFVISARQRMVATGGTRRAGTFPFCRPWTMNIDGTGKTVYEDPETGVTPGPGQDVEFDWGPAGEIAMASRGVVRAFTPGNASRLVSDDADHYWWDPVWNEDGTKLAVTELPRDQFGDPESAKTDIWSIGSDGDNLVNLTQSPERFEDHPTWSDDGSEIAYAGQSEFGDATVYMMAFDGSDKTEVNLGNLFFREVTPVAWSTGSTFLGLVTQDTEDTVRFGFVPITNDQEISQVFELPAGAQAQDWVGSVDSKPIAQDQELTVPGDGSAKVDLVATDADGDPITYAVLTQPAHGTLTGTPPALTYQAQTGYEGPDSFTWQASANGQQSNIATVSITVSPPCTVEGTAERDVLRGTSDDDVICALGGHDVVLGLGGADTILGGAGDDDLVGGAGDDVIDGGLDDDSVRGDAGNDQLVGGEGRDTVSYLHAPRGARVDLASQTATASGMGHDTITGIENAAGSAESDQLEGDGGFNQLFGGMGKDTLSGGAGRDELAGGNGRDLLKGQAGMDILFGGEGTDALRGGSGRDVCYLDPAGSMKGCENPDATRPGRVVVDAAQAPARRRQATMTRWYIGNDDYVVVYNSEATQFLNVGSFPSKDAWEGYVCSFLKFTPIKTACSVTDKLQSVSKWQLEWFASNARSWNACAVVVWDYGRHGVNQFKKRWKTRPASDYQNHIDLAWVTPGKYSYVRTSDPGEVGGAEYIPVTC